MSTSYAGDGSEGLAATIEQNATFVGRGVFVITGQVSGGTGATSVEVTANVDGVETDLGAAAVATDGIYSFADRVGRHHQGFVTATATDAAGDTSSAVAPYSLQAGLRGAQGVTRQDSFVDGEQTATEFYLQGGGSKVVAQAPGQTLTSTEFDIFGAGRADNTTFVFQPGFGLDVVAGFGARGAGHDTLDLPASDFTSIADVLRNTGDVGGSAFITDPVTGDAIRLAGVTTKELARNAGHDITLHG